VVFKNFFAESKKMHSSKNFFDESLPVGSRQRNLCQVFFSLTRVFWLALGKEASLPSVFYVPRVF
jgi:hypothetical protein